MTPARKAARVACWIAPSLVCLLVYRRGFAAWFRGGDFDWLGLTERVHSLRDLLDMLVLPSAAGTFRPLSERAFFMAGFSLFGLNAVPFRIAIFATQFANLVLVAAIGSRLTGRRTAGLLAALFWVVNGAPIEPLGWVSGYNQAMCAFCMLLAFYFLLRSVEADGGGDFRLAKRYQGLQWLAFLAGFGAQELNVVYPALAAGYTFLFARPQFRRTLGMFSVSALYILGHNRLAPFQTTGEYGFHFNAGMLAVLGKYWAWSVSSAHLATPLSVPPWLVPAGAIIVSLGLLAFLAGKLRSGILTSSNGRTAAFCLGWYLMTLAPVLPLGDHMMGYYLYAPLIGLCWLGGWAVSEAWLAGPSIRAAATALALLYGFLALPHALDGSERNYQLTIRVRRLVEGVARAHELHPGKTLLLDGVDSEQFWNAIVDHPFQAIGIDRVYLTPGSQRRIEAHPDLGELDDFVLPAQIVSQGLDRGDTLVYDVSGPETRDITAAYAGRPRDTKAPERVDAGNPLTAYLFGPEWYPAEGGQRWMPRRATLRIGGPAGPGQELHLAGVCSPQQLRAGPILVTVTVDGSTLAPTGIHPRNTAFDVAFPLPDSVVGKNEIEVVVEVNRTFRTPHDRRDLGLEFGVFEVR